MYTMFINQSDEAVQRICEADPEMQKLIKAVGDLEVPLRNNYFMSLVRSIIGQQISVSAAQAIYDRLEKLLDNEVTAQTLLSVTPEQLREAGLTYRKIEYVKDLATKAANAELDLQHITKLDNPSVMKHLTNVKGIGKWTAEMFLILSLGRMDILAIDDVGLQRGAQWLYQVDKADRRSILIEKSPLWEPNLSIASFYLWEAVHLHFITDYDSINSVI